MRRIGVRLTGPLGALAFLCAMVGLCAWALWPSGAGAGSSARSEVAVRDLASQAPSAGGTPLASIGAPSVESLTDQPLAAQAVAARRASPGAFAERRRSRTAYEHLGAAAAAAVARQAFPRVVDEPAGGPPQLPAGTRIVHYLSDHAAQLELPHGKHGVVETIQPIALTTSAGGHEPIDLALHEAGGAYSPDVSPSEVRIAKTAAGGASLPSVGVSLTPVNAQGQPLGGAEGSVQGSTVFYGDTATDSDTLAKPTTLGFEEDTVLRSADSPRTLYFKVGMPEGARLVQDAKSGAVRIVDDKQTIADIPASGATDAEGASIPVSTSVSGDVIALTVGGSEVRYPIEVDPSVATDNKIYLPGDYEHNNWEFVASSTPSPFAERQGLYEPVEPSIVDAGPYEKGQFAVLGYETQKESHIYKFRVESYDTGSGTEGSPSQAIQTGIFIQNEGKGLEGEEKILKYKGTGEATACAGSCEPVAVTETNKANGAAFNVRAVETGSEWFEYYMDNAEVFIAQEKGPSVRFDEGDETLDGKPNAGTRKWVNTKSAVIGVDAFDPGTGIDAVGIKTEKPGWLQGNSESECAGAKLNKDEGVQCNECYENECKLTKEHSKPFVLEIPEGLPEGHDVGVEVTVKDAEGLTAMASTGLNIDNAPPHNLALNGIPPSDEITEGVYHLTAEASDGKAGEGLSETKSSGVKSLVLTIDGKEVGSPSGSCPEGPCTAHGEWAISGSAYGAGKHLATLVATDNVGNVEKLEVPFTIHPASPVALGPGSVNAESGEFTLTSTDVSMGPGLTVTRSYSSRHLTEGVNGPFGAQWSIGLGNQEMLVKQPNGSMVLVGASGGREIFAAKSNGGYESPAGDVNLTLSSTPCEPGASEYMLADAATGAVTCFKAPAGGKGEVFAPSVQREAEPGNTVSYSYEIKTVEGKETLRPHAALASIPQNVTCPIEEHKLLRETLKPGCRALAFDYAEATSAKGENRSEWGEYNGRLKEIKMVAYNPSSKAMAEVGVAAYSYDKQGRLRAEWDPRVESSTDCGKTCAALKTTYGYDSEGHVTALDPPGREPWSFIYGTLASDPGTGRLLKATQSASSEALWNGSLPVNSSAPKIIYSKALVGERFTVAENGSWENAPMVYGYQWEDCNSAGEGCTAIAGANSPTYVASGTDIGRRLVAKVTATNGGGSMSASTVATAEVKIGVEHTLTYNWDVHGIAEGPEESMWVSDGQYIEEFPSSGESKSYPAGSCVSGIVAGPSKSMWFGNECGEGEIGQMETSSGAVTWHELPVSKEYPKVATPTAITYGPDGNLWITDSYGNRIYEMTSSGAVTTYAQPAYSEPYDITVGPDKNLWFTEVKAGTIVKMTTSGEKTEYHEGVKTPLAITNGPEGDLWFTEGNGVSKITTSGAVSVVNENVCGGEAIVEGSEGNLWISCINGEVARMTPTGIVTKFTLAHKDTLGAESIAVASHSHRIWVGNGGSEGAWTTEIDPAVAEGEWSEVPGWAVDYDVPLSGAEAPHEMGEAEVATWGQKDDPVEATAVFPPDVPGGSPPVNYSYATVYYLDNDGRIVNVLNQRKGISTTEYNAHNDVERTLSADNRELALKEAKPLEASKLFDTESKYNSEGTELESTLGPRHLVKLANGKETQARSHTVYSYDEGAPSEGGPYRLVTKVRQGAAIVGETEQDVRTTTTAYSGQGGLGWKLRKPTAVTGEGSGLKITHTMLYNENTGAVVETRTPGWTSGYTGAGYKSQFGAKGSGNGQFKSPSDVTTDSSGDVWVADTSNDRVEEFNSEGTFIQAFGSAGTGNGQFEEPEGIAVSKDYVWVSDTGNNRVQEFKIEGEHVTYIRQFGSVGSGGLSLKKPEGLSVDASGDVWVADDLNNRVEEFSPEGFYLKALGSTGTGNGQFEEPSDLGFNAEGKLYVLDHGNHRIQEFQNLSTSIVPSYVSGFGAEGSGSGQLKSPWDVAVDAFGDEWVADTGNNRIEEFNSEGTLVRTIGEYGTGPGQFKSPEGIAVKGTNVWVSDTGNNRVEEFTALTGVYVQQFGTGGQGNGQFNHPEGLTVGSGGDLWVADRGNNRVQEFSSEGVYLKTVGIEGSGSGQLKAPSDVAWAAGKLEVLDHGNHRVETFQNTSASIAPSYASSFGSEGSGEGKFKAPMEMTVDASGNIWVVDSGNDRVEEFNSKGAFLRMFGSAGSGNGQFKSPSGIAVQGEDVWVSDWENNRVEEFNNRGVYIRQFGSAGTNNGQFKGPGGLAVDSKGDVWVADEYNNRVQEFGPEGTYMTKFGSYGTENGEFNTPNRLTFNAEGDLYVSDLDNRRIEEFNTKLEYMRKFGSEGSGEGQFVNAYGLTIGPEGNVWVVDDGNNRVEVFTGSGAYVGQFGSSGSGNGQFNTPHAVAIYGSNVYVTDCGNDRVQIFSELTGEYAGQFGSEGKGNGQMENAWRMSVGPEGYTWLSDSSDNRVEVFSGSGSYIGQFGSEGTGNGQFKSTAGVAISGSNVYVLDNGNDRVERFSLMTGEYVNQFGKKGTGNGEMETAWRMTVGPEGYLWLSDSSDDRVEQLSGAGSYIAQFGAAGTGAGQFKQTYGVGVYGTSLYALDNGGDRVERWTVKASPHATKTIYYSAEANGEVHRCGEHPEWANLVCETLPAAQPETGGLPSLPVTTVESYDMWGEPLVTVSETVTGSEKHTRTTTNKYDEAGRPIESQATSTNGKALPAVQDKYEEASGALVELSTTTGGKTESIKSEYNLLGQLTKYTDASGNLSTFEYETEPMSLARPIAANDGKELQSYSYFSGEGGLASMTDYAAGAFKATYDVEGNQITEELPNGMTVYYTHNTAGETTGVEYVKSTHCSEKCVWFKESSVPSIHGQDMSQSVELPGETGKDTYTYDAAGRLTQAQEEPAGSKKCTTRIYGYDEETDRTSLTKDEPNAKGECSTESGGTTEKHTYDEADRLIDSGVTYEPFGEISSLPASDAGGSILTSSFYADGQLAEQKQDEQTIGYTLDPAHRTLETVWTGKVAADVTNHYAGPGSTPAWTSEPSGKWTREITGIDGNLAGIQYNGEKTVLQVSNLHGDVVATVADSETATGLESKVKEATAYGVPGSEAPPKYSWLGAHELATGLPSGVVNMGARSYVPQLGRFLQTDPIPGGSANPYAYTQGDPLDETDLSGEYSLKLKAWFITGVETQTDYAVEVREAEIRAAEEAAARAEAERLAAEGGSGSAEEGGEEGGEVEEEEEAEEEPAAYHSGSGRWQETPAVEQGIMFEQGENGTGLARELGEQARLCEHERQGSKAESATGACARYASIFGEALKVVKSAWKTIKKVGGKLLHTAKRVWNYILEKRCDADSPASACKRKNVASTCEVSNVGLFIGGFAPESSALKWLIQGGSFVALGSC